MEVSRKRSNIKGQMSKACFNDIKIQNAAYFDESHPNYKRWEKGRKLSYERGKFVLELLENFITPKNLTVLDIGSGWGGTSKVFSENNFVVSFDLNLLRLQNQTKQKNNLSIVNGDALFLPFKNRTFDVIILQDVIEHLPHLKHFSESLNKILMKDGIIFLSTPNKFSIVNFISDPHWGMPFAALFKRQNVKKYFLKYFRKNDQHRNDIAQLLSLEQIKGIFNANFDISLNTKFAVKKLFEGNKGIVWSSFHISLIEVLKLFYLDKTIIKLSNDKFGFINRFFTPTFYFILKKK